MGKKICFVSSSGGHWEELMCLYPIAKEHDSFFVTEEGGQVSDRNLNQIYTFRQINRKEKTFLFHFVRLFAFACKIISKERPDAQ